MGRQLVARLCQPCRLAGVWPIPRVLLSWLDFPGSSMDRRPFIDSVAARLAAWHAGRLTRQFFRAVERATAAQERLLAELISEGTESEFGRRRCFDRIRGYADFAA